MEKIKVINRSSNQLPEYETPGAVGMDLRADITEQIVLHPLERALVPTGLFVQLPLGTELQVRPRSGLATKFGITVLNAPGTIDPDYRGEIKVIIVNLSKDTYTIEPGERIAQMVLAHYERGQWEQVNEIEPSERGQGGFGSTGK
ncbi:MAG: dUTP diphosphatase [Mucinivorans sp.]